MMRTYYTVTWTVASDATISLCRRDFWSEKLMRDFVCRLGGIKKCNVVEVKTDGHGMMKVRNLRNAAAFTA